MFNTKTTKQECVNWIRNWFLENGNGCNAIIGISGGKDSSIVAALCVEALGKDRTVLTLEFNKKSGNKKVSEENKRKKTSEENKR